MVFNRLMERAKLLFSFMVLMLPLIVSGQLTGTKTIGGTSPDYANISAAITALSGSGVGAGGVTFLLRDGTYTGQVTIPVVSGASAANQIVFKSENEDASAVTIQHTANVLLLNGKFVTLQHLTIDNTGTGGAAIVLGTNADDNAIDHCILSGISSVGTAFANAVIYSSQTTNGNGVDNFSLTNSTISDGHHGIYMTMNATERPSGLVIENNVFENNGNGRGIYLIQFTAPRIEGNTIRTAETGTGIYGISLEGCQGQTRIVSNYIYTVDSGRMRTGIVLNSNNAGTSGNNALMANNSIQLQNTNSLAYPIEIANAGNNYWDIFNNTVYISGGTSASNRVFYQTTAGNVDINIKNNIFVDASTANSYLLYFGNSPGYNNFDYNCYWFADSPNYKRSRIGNSDRTTFAAHIAQSGETHSVNINPEMTFVPGVGWKATASALTGAGQYQSSVPLDIDRLTRVNPGTTIGAHENGAAASNPPVADFSADILNPCIGETVSFSDASSDGPTSWQWTFTGPAAVTYVESTSATSMNPKVQFNAAGTYTVKLEVSNSSGDDDETKTNYITVKAAMAGAYTINSGAATGGSNYNSFSDAVDDLICRGISAAVTFTVAVPSGPYTEQISIPEIAGASATNTITFKGQSGDRDDVILSFASSGSIANNYTVQLDGADYIRFRDMTIERSGSSTYACVVNLSGDASYNEFDNILFSGRTGTASLSAALVVSDDNNVGNANNSFENSHFLNGAAGIYYKGANGNLKPGLSVVNNLFENYRYGLDLEYLTGVTVSGNEIINAASFNSASTQGIYAFHLEGALEISKNKITLTGGTNRQGIELNACTGSALLVGDISNNMIVIGGTGTIYGINSGSTTTYKNYYFNSVYNTGTNATSASAFYLNGSQNINLQNNNLYATVGVALRILAATNFNSDYNNLYSTGSYIGYLSANQATLSDWQTATGHDANSISTDPMYVSASDLHLQAGSPLFGMGTAITGITTDIDDEERNDPPTIGADEIADSCDEPVATSHPANSSVCQGVNTSFSVSYTGDETMNFQWQVNSGSGWTNLSNGGVYSGVNTDALSISTTTAGMNANLYRVVLSNDCGSDESNGATLTVNDCSTPPPPNDHPTSGSGLLTSPNYVYPNCYQINGTTVGATVNPATGEKDVWYRFEAFSNGTSLRVSSTTMDAKVYLFDSADLSTPLKVVDQIQGSGTEILNYDGLTAGHLYRIAVTPADGVEGDFQICLQQLRLPLCDKTGTMSLCDLFKVKPTGATNVSISFTDDNENTVSQTTSTFVTLSQESLGLKPEWNYSVGLVANYNALVDGLGNPEPIVVTNPEACNITIAPHTPVVLRAADRCSNLANLLRNAYIYGNTSGLCGANGYKVEFVEMSACNGTTIGLPFEKTVLGTLPRISLNYVFNATQFEGLTGVGYWRVRWKPRFGNGYYGTYGDAYVIGVNATAPGAGMVFGPSEASNGLTTGENISANIYPNPNNGDMVNINVTGLKTTTQDVYVRILDAMGREVYNNRFEAEGSLNTIVSFSKPLASGLYMVEFRNGDSVITQRMMVSK